MPCRCAPPPQMRMHSLATTRGIRHRMRFCETRSRLPGVYVGSVGFCPIIGGPPSCRLPFTSVTRPCLHSTTKEPEPIRGSRRYFKCTSVGPRLRSRPNRSESVCCPTLCERLSSAPRSSWVRLCRAAKRGSGVPSRFSIGDSVFSCGRADCHCPY